MTVQNAAEAVAMAEQRSSLDLVLKDIEFAAKRGNRRWMFSSLSEEVCKELVDRGFSVTRGFNMERTTGYVEVSW